MGLYTAVTLSDKHNRKVSPSGLKGPQGQDQPQGETSEGICLRVWPMDWTGAEGSIPAEEKRVCLSSHATPSRARQRSINKRYCCFVGSKGALTAPCVYVCEGCWGPEVRVMSTMPAPVQPGSVSSSFLSTMRSCSPFSCSQQPCLSGQGGPNTLERLHVTRSAPCQSHFFTLSPRLLQTLPSDVLSPCFPQGQG